MRSQILWVLRVRVTSRRSRVMLKGGQRLWSSTFSFAERATKGIPPGLLNIKNNLRDCVRALPNK